MKSHRRLFIDPKDTTSYNHAVVGNGKPVIPNERFKAVLELIDKGQTHWIERTERFYALDPAQIALLNDRKERIK
jgi:hypothetical protein